MADIVVQAEPRNVGSTNLARRMRRADKLPAVIYGGEGDSLPVAVDPRAVTRILKSESGENTVFQVQIEGGEPETVMIFDYQIDPITHSLMHADFVRIAMDEAIEVEVPIELIGVPKGVEVDGGVLDHSLREVTIECLPGDIPDEFTVDVSELEIGDSVHVSDLRIPPSVTLVTDTGRTVASVVPPVSEEELEAAIEPLVEGAAPELVGEEEGEAAEAEAAEEEAPEEEGEGEEKEGSEG